MVWCFNSVFEGVPGMCISYFVLALQCVKVC